MESLELRHLRQYLKDCGVPHKVTAGYETSGHVVNSYHGRSGTQGDGLALDVAGLVPSWDSEALRAVYKALEPLGPHCAELIYAGPGGGFWKNGRKVGPYAAAGHHNHVHIALPKGTFVTFTGKQGSTIGGVTSENIIVTQSPVVGLVPTPTGKGYWIITARGEVFSFGDAQYYGRVEYQGEL